MLCISLNALSDFEQVWVFDDPMQPSFVVPSTLASTYYYHNMIDGIAHTQSQSTQAYIPGWHQGNIPAPGYVGFSRAGEDPLVNPVFCAQPPQIHATTLLEIDAAGDQLYNPMLDIVESRFAYSSERLYFAFKCSTPSYATASGFTYFAYMPVIVNPATHMEDNPIVYGLMYTVNLPPMISAGLYKVSGTGFDGLTRLGNIEFSIQDDYLVLSCAKADLLADAEFASWYDPAYPVFATTVTTSRITLINGIQQADMTPGTKVLLTPHLVDVQNLNPPILSNPEASPNIDATGLIARIDYYDADANVPHLAYVYLDEQGPYELLPTYTAELDFGQAVTYSSTLIPLESNEQTLTFTFSDGADTVQEVLHYSGTANSDATHNPIARLRLYPNPTSAMLHIEAKTALQHPLSIYNLKGQKVAAVEHHIKGGSSDVSHLAPGIYILKGKGIQSSRFVKF